MQKVECPKCHSLLSTSNNTSNSRMFTCGDSALEALIIISVYHCSIFNTAILSFHNPIPRGQTSQYAACKSLIVRKENDQYPLHLVERSSAISFCTQCKRYLIFSSFHRVVQCTNCSHCIRLYFPEDYRAHLIRATSAWQNDKWFGAGNAVRCKTLLQTKFTTLFSVACDHVLFVATHQIDNGFYGKSLLCMCQLDVESVSNTMVVVEQPNGTLTLARPVHE